MKRQIKAEIRDKKSILTRNHGSEELVGLSILNHKLFIEAKNINIVLSKNEVIEMLRIVKNLIENDDLF